MNVFIWTQFMVGKEKGECFPLMNKYLSLIIFILKILWTFNEIMLQKKKHYHKKMINILKYFWQILLSLKHCTNIYI